MSTEDGRFSEHTVRYLDAVERRLETMAPEAVARRVVDLVEDHDAWRRRRCLNLIPAENALSRNARRLLDSDIHIKLSTTSFRIQPQQTYYVFYEATAPHTPAWFVIYANFTGFAFRTAQGMNVRLQLPHTVYLLPKHSVEKSELHVLRADLDATENKVILEVENTGANFGRILQTHLLYSKKRQEAPGFPVFPHSKRILEVPLEQKAEGENVPVEVSLELEKFKLEQKLQRHNSTESASGAPASALVGTGTRGGDRP